MEEALKMALKERAESALAYTALASPEQNNEFEIEVTSNAIYFIPIMPTTFIINEELYNKIFNILSIALTPTVTLIKPLSMQIKIFPKNKPEKQRALLYPMHLGRSHRLICTVNDLTGIYFQTGEIPIMDRISWDPIKSPHLIVTGVSGSGKSYFMHTLYSICEKIIDQDQNQKKGQVVVIDPKLSDLARIAKNNVSTKLVIPDFSENSRQGIGGRYLTTVINELKELENEMYRRQNILYQQNKVSINFKAAGLNPIFLFIDEAAALLTGANRQMKQDYLDTLTRLAILGREAGLFLVLSMQSARADYIPTIVRDSISVRIQLGRINSENTRFLFPELKDMPMIPMGGNGSGIISIAGAGSNTMAGIEPVATPTIIEGD